MFQNSIFYVEAFNEAFLREASIKNTDIKSANSIYWDFINWHIKAKYSGYIRNILVLGNTLI